ncbi:hypothetical protein [Streptomyces sp. NPDC049915]|uniref:hypothetical protein n=1 Tax=Streptomyces sp. NPDC049915 TaxID=3155510 RepID=UPI00342FF2B9
MGTIAGAVAAIGTLMFTGVATYFSAEVARDQLQQSREAAERAKKSQARLISVWAENDTNDDIAIHVLNRSRDAISDTEVRFLVKGRVGKEAVRTAFDISAQTMSPCSQLTLTSRALWASTRGHPAKVQQYVTNDMSWYKSHGYGRLAYENIADVAAVFYDRDGLLWTRGEGLTDGGTWDLPGGYAQGIYEGQPKRSSLPSEECTDETP